jgi:hypothetical protein
MSISLECVDRERSPAPFSPGRPRLKILVVEDEALIALDLQDRLENSLPENLFSAQPSTMGVRLVQALTAQLGGNLQVGTAPKFTVTFPASTPGRTNKHPKGRIGD